MLLIALSERADGLIIAHNLCLLVNTKCGLIVTRSFAIRVETPQILRMERREHRVLVIGSLGCHYVFQASDAQHGLGCRPLSCQVASFCSSIPIIGRVNILTDK